MKKQGLSDKATFFMYQNPKFNKAANSFHKSLKEISNMLGGKNKKK